VQEPVGLLVSREALLPIGSRKVVTGLDVGATSVKAVRLAHGGRKTALLGLAIADIGPDHDETPSDGPKVDRRAEAIREVLHRCGARAHRQAPIMTAVGGAGVSIKHVAFPPMPRHVLAESIHWEARKHVPFGESEFVLDFQILDEPGGEDDEKMQVLLAAVETELVDEHIAALAIAGVEPDAVDLVPLALMNEADEEGLLNSSTIAVVDLGVSAINLAIHRRGGLFFSRTVPLLPAGRLSSRQNGPQTGGWNRPDQAGATSGAVPDDHTWREVAASEIRRSLTFYNNETGKKGIEKMYLSGGRALVPGIAEELTQGLGISTELLDPLGSVEDSAVELGDLAEHSARFALAMGLARRT
jgi:type IV pilus assembly protein PilM